MFALDTNTVSYFFRGEGRVAATLLSKPRRMIAVPSVVRYELRRGLLALPASRARAAKLEALDAFLASVQSLPFDDAAAEVAAAIHAQLKRAGKPIEPHDLLIAATALAAGATLVTNNVREFRQVKSLVLENWFE
jgi:tRNA(fMet)-specific endonuclease VapC